MENIYYYEKNFLWEKGGARFHKNHKKLMWLLKEFKMLDQMLPLSNEIKHLNNKFKYENVTTSSILDEIVKKKKAISNEKMRNISFEEYARLVVGNEKTNYLLKYFEYKSDLQVLNAYDGYQIYTRDFNQKIKYYILKTGLQELVNKIVDYLNENDCKILLNTKVVDINKNNQQQEYYKITDSKGNNYLTNILVLALPKYSLLSLNYLSDIKNKLNSVECIPLNRIYTIFPKDKNNNVWFQNLGKITVEGNIKYFIPISYEQNIAMISYTDGENANYWKNLELKNSQEFQKRL